jgi:CHAT domain-containing protein/Tfp pilus assembly protein PilF
LNGISEFSKLLLVGLGKRAKAQKGIAIVLFTIACILGSTSGLPLISSSGSSTAIAQSIDERKAEGDRLFEQGLQHHWDGQFQQAIESFQQAAKIYQEIGDHRGRISALFYLGGVYYAIGEIYSRQGRHLQALDYYQQSLTLAIKIGDRVGEAVTLGRIGLAYHGLGQFVQALESYQKDLAIHRELTNQPQEGIIYEIRQTSDYLNHTELDNRRGEGRILQQIAGVYSNLGRDALALEQLQQALTIARETGDREGEATALSSLSAVYMNLMQYSEALEQSQQALAIAKELGSPTMIGANLSNIGAIYITLERYPEALEYQQQALSVARAYGIRSGEAMVLMNIGAVYDKLQQYPQSLDSYQQALVISREIRGRVIEGALLEAIGSIFLKSGQFLKAEKTLLEALSVIESLRDSELSDIDKVSLYDTQRGIYAGLQQVLIAQNRPDSALEISERGRVRAFVELLSSQFSNIPNNDSSPRQVSPSVADIRRIAQMQNATLVHYSLPNADKLYIWLIKATGEIHFQSVDIKNLKFLTDLVSSSREAIGVRNPSEPATIVPELKPEAQQRQQAQQRQKLQQLHQLLIEPIAQYLPSNPDERVIFIPQGELFLVPFPALVDAQGKYLIEKHTILTAPSIEVLDLTRQQRQSTAANSGSPIQGDNVLVVGNPIMPKVWNPAKGIEEQLSSLPGAEEEAVTIAKAFATKPLLWEQATETTVAQQMPEARIIHLSTHGLLEYGNPQDSGARDVPGAIALSPSSKDDGLLTSAEILQMKLKAELVVLSACDTGRGRITGDGVIGLSRSLITAGVPSVIVSLWSVPDAPTADLMSEFYRQWQQNPDKAKALRQAMLITMQNHPNPRDWAAFTLIGESE